MKRVLQIVGALKRLTGQIESASETPMNLNGQDTVLMNPKWMKALANSMNSMAEVLTEVVAERLGEPHIVSEGGDAWVCVKCNRIWAEEIEKCSICGMSKEDAGVEKKEEPDE